MNFRWTLDKQITFRGVRNAVILASLVVNVVLVARFVYHVKRCDWRGGVVIRSLETKTWTCILPTENEEDERQESESPARARA